MSPDEQSEGMRNSTPSPLRRFGQGPSHSSHRLVSQSAMPQEGSVYCCRSIKHKTYCPLNYHWVEAIIFSNYFRAHREEIRCAFDLPWFVDQVSASF